MNRRSFLLLAFSAAAHACILAQDARVVTRIVTDTVPAWKTWDSPTGTLNYPGNWTVVQPPAGDTVAVFRKAVKDAGGHAPQVALLVHELKGRSVSPKDRAKAPAGGDVQVIATTPQEPDGSFSTEFTATARGVLEHNLEQVLVQDDRSYTLIYTAVPETYEEDLFQAQAIMNSFVPRKLP